MKLCLQIDIAVQRTSANQNRKFYLYCRGFVVEHWLLVSQLRVKSNYVRQLNFKAYMFIGSHNKSECVPG